MIVIVAVMLWFAFAQSRPSTITKEKFEKYLKDGEVVSIMPEGTRRGKGNVEPHVHGGAALIARMGKAPILPLAVRNVDKIKRKGERVRFPKVTIVYGDPVYLSKGVLTKFFGDDDIQSVITAVGKFQDGDYGTAAEHGKTSKPGHEYGRYEIGGLEAEDGEDCAVWIHKAEDALIVYFKFER